MLPAAAAGSGDDAMYLVNERFMVKQSPDGYVYPSSWDTDNSGGGVYNGARLNDTSSTASVSVSRTYIPVTSGIVTAEFTFIVTDAINANGFHFDLKSGDVSAVTVKSQNSSLYLISGNQSYPLGQFWTTGSWHSFKVVANLDTQKVDVYMAGIRYAQNIAFTNSVSSLDGVLISTGDETRCVLHLRACRIYTNYYLNEKFISVPGNSNLPTNWQSSGKNNGASIESMRSEDDRDTSSIRLVDSSTSSEVYASCDFTPKPNRDYVWFYTFLIPEKVDGMKSALVNSQNNLGLTFITQGGNLCYLGDGGAATVLVQDYLPNLWYSIKAVARPRSKAVDIYVNGKLKVENATVSLLQDTLNKVIFSTPASGTGTMWVDDILVYPAPVEPSDYVPVPVPVEKPAGALQIGLQTCSLWREGDQWGWDRIAPYRERKPLLGFYDEGNPETADWEIKWALEHGVDFMSFCWFRAAQNTPIKRGIHDPHLIDGFMYAKYSDMFKFMIMWENGNDQGIADVNDFQTNVIPYWIEYLFKDPRYLKIDNKPVLGIFSYGNLQTQLAPTSISAGLNMIRQACIDAGFDGAYIILSTTQTNQTTLSRYKTNDGFDAVFPYSWGDLSGVKAVQQTKLTEQQNGVDTIPTLTFGRDNRAWFSETGQIASPDEFASTAKWIKDVFLQKNINTIPNSIASKIMLVGNWNEFGEGHYIMPSALAGFGYLEGLRALCTDSPHTDVVPTASQLERINQLYPRGRVMPLRPNLSPPPIPFVDTKKWDFASGAEGWTASGSTVRAVDGTLEVTGSRNGTTRRILSPNNLGLSASTVPFIKIRVKNENNNSGCIIYFSTNTQTTMDEAKRVDVRFAANDSIYSEYLIDMRQNENWAGTIRQIRFDLPSGTNKVTVDYVYLSDDSIIMAGTNLIEDWGFDDGTLPSGAVDCGMEISTADFTPGTFKSLKVTPTQPSGAVYYDLPGVVNDKPFYYSAQAKVPFDTVPNAGAALSLSLSYKIGAKVKTVYLTSSGQMTSDAWRKVSVVHSISESEKVSDVRLVISASTLTNPNTFFLDTVEARPIVTEAATVPIDGATEVNVQTPISITMPSGVPLSAPSVASANITVNGAAATAALEGGTKVSITPSAPLQKGRIYSVMAAGLVTTSGVSLPNIVFTFSTQPEESSQKFYINYGSGAQREITNTGIEPGLITAVTTVSIVDSVDRKAVSIIALYNGDQLENAYFSPITLKANMPNEVISDINVPSTAGKVYTVKHLIWDSITGPGAPRLPAAVLD